MGAGFITTWFSLHYRTITSRGDSPFAPSHSGVEPDGGQANSPQASPQGPRFQFSLAALMIAVTVVSILCSLSAWLKLPWMVLPVLAIGPIGGKIVAHLRKPRHDWAVSLYSGMVTTTLWVFVAFCGGLAVALSGPNANAGDAIVMSVAAALCFSPFAFVVGVLSSVVREVAAGVTTETWKLIVKRMFPDRRVRENNECCGDDSTTSSSEAVLAGESVW
jgi:hypothetical protein